MIVRENLFLYPLISFKYSEKQKGKLTSADIASTSLSRPLFPNLLFLPQVENSLEKISMPGFLFITASSSQSLVPLLDTCRGEEAVTGGEEEVGVLQHNLSLLLALQVLLPDKESCKHFWKSVGVTKPEEAKGSQHRILILRKPLKQMAQDLHSRLFPLAGLPADF